MLSMKRRKEDPIRFRRVKANSSIASAQKTIEKELDCPRGSVKLVYPGGRKARADSSVGALRRRWT